MNATVDTLQARPWYQTLEPLFASTRPDRHAVLDDVLQPAALETLRGELLSSWAWRYRSQPGYVLCMDPAQAVAIQELSAWLGSQLSAFRPGIEARETWAFLHQRPFEEFVHADVGSYVLTLWLTPERWDLSPETGGLHLFPVARPDGMPNVRDTTLRYFNDQAVGPKTHVQYRQNRGVLFPASTFHAVGPCRFDASNTERMRCSVTIIFDELTHWQDQHAAQPDEHGDTT